MTGRSSTTSIASSGTDNSSTLGATRNPSCSGSMESDIMVDALEIEVHANEVVAWSQLSHLRDWLPGTQHVKLLVPVEATTDRVVDTLRLCGNLFHQLEHIQVCVAGANWQLGQAVVGGVAELVQLRSLRLEGGAFDVENIRLHVLAGLKQLESLTLLPLTGEGLSDEHLVDGLALLSGLTHLQFRGCAELLTDEGLTSLTTLTALRRLSITPLGLQVTRAGLATLCQELHALEVVHTGFSQSQQVDVLQSIPPRVHHAAVVVVDPDTECASLLASLSLCLQTTLSSLRVMNNIKVEDTFFMVALGALTALTELSLSVVPARPATPAFLLNLAVLSPLKRLQSLELNVVGDRIKMAMTPQLMSTLSATLTDLTHLALSCMVPPEPLTSQGALTGQFRGPLQPLALTHLAQFSKLKSLTLIAPLVAAEEEGGEQGQLRTSGSGVLRTSASGSGRPSSDGRGSVRRSVDLARKPSTSGAAPAARETPGSIPLALSCLPPSLESLELERAQLVITPPAAAAAAAAAAQLAAGEGAEQPAVAVDLGRLRRLALGRCEVDDATLSTLFASANQLTRLELNEVCGISATSLRAMSTLSLRHLEVVDLRDASKQSSTNSHPTEPAPATNTWWGWLMGTAPPEVPEEAAGAAAALAALPRPAAPMLRHDDILALSHMTTLRHLQWGVGRPLGLPVGSLTDSDGHAIEDPADLTMGARMALEDLKATHKAVSALTDLHELYVDTSHSGVTEDEWEAGVVAGWLSVDAQQAETPGASVVAARLASVPSGAVPAAVGVKPRSSLGGGAGGPKAPKWLVAGAPVGCFCSGTLPVARHDAWSGTDFYEVL